MSNPPPPDIETPHWVGTFNIVAGGGQGEVINYSRDYYRDADV